MKKRIISVLIICSIFVFLIPMYYFNNFHNISSMGMLLLDNLIILFKMIFDGNFHISDLGYMLTQFLLILVISLPLVLEILMLIFNFKDKKKVVKLLGIFHFISLIINIFIIGQILFIIPIVISLLIMIFSLFFYKPKCI